MKNEQGGIVFIKDNGIPIRSFNIATGVKSFGILQLLINSSSVNPNSLLIIDEPEVHLHPKWEVEYAKVIVELVKAGIQVLISSHSPYLIEALSKYSNSGGIQDKTKFYFGDKTADGFSTFEETIDLLPIFSKLAAPMRDLTNLN